MSLKNRYSQVLLVCLVAGIAFTAGATDRYAPTYAQMDAAAQRYAEAQVRLAKGDETATTDMTRALEDVEDLARGCMKQKRCNAARVITVYEGMLKSHDLGPDADMAMVGEGDDEPDHASPILANSPQAQKAIGMLPDGHQFDRMVEFNEPVQAAMRDWLTSRRSFLIDAHENYQYMRYLMYPEYQKSGLPEALLFGIMAQESGGKVHSVSRSGASGPLQFMPATGARFGLGRDVSGVGSTRGNSRPYFFGCRNSHAAAITIGT
jgi:membrane-bound lytic murein transglycosylase D